MVSALTNMRMRAQEWGRTGMARDGQGFSTALQKTAAGLRKGLGRGKGLEGGITQGDSCLVFISSSQRREEIVFPFGRACPHRLLAQPELMLTVHTQNLLPTVSRAPSLLPGK